MKALTIKRPYAQAVAGGYKPVENRTWTTDHLGEIGIHAGHGWHLGADADRLITRMFADVAARSGLPAGAVAVALLAGARQNVPGGVLLAVVDLTGVCSAAVEERPCGCGPWALPGQYHWQLSNVRPLAAPFPCRGAQRLWTPPFDAQTALEYAAVAPALPDTTPGETPA